MEYKILVDSDGEDRPVAEFPYVLGFILCSALVCIGSLIILFNLTQQ